MTSRITQLRQQWYYWAAEAFHKPTSSRLLQKRRRRSCNPTRWSRTALEIFILSWCPHEAVSSIRVGATPSGLLRSFESVCQGPASDSVAQHCPCTFAGNKQSLCFSSFSENELHKPIGLSCKIFVCWHQTAGVMKLFRARKKSCN